MLEVGQEGAAKAEALVEMVAANYPAVAAVVSGLGRFSGSPSSDGQDVLYASVDSPDLLDVRNELCKLLDISEIPYRREHGFTPHVTLKYVPWDAKLPFDRLDPEEFTFREISLVVGGRWTSFKLTGDLAYA